MSRNITWSAHWPVCSAALGQVIAECQGGQGVLASQVALKATVHSSPPSIAQASLARSNRQSPRPRSMTFSPWRSTARSVIPSESMSIG